MFRWPEHSWPGDRALDPALASHPCEAFLLRIVALFNVASTVLCESHALGIRFVTQSALRIGTVSQRRAVA